MTPLGSAAMSSGFRPDDAVAHTRDRWPADVLPLLDTYARIPGLSPAFDPEWEANGRLEETADSWRPGPGVAPWTGLRSRSCGSPGSPPPSSSMSPPPIPRPPAPSGLRPLRQTAPFEGWTGGRGPWSPVLEGEWLYGRGVADDGYAPPFRADGPRGRAGRGRPARPVRDHGRGLRGERQSPPARGVGPSVRTAWCARCGHRPRFGLPDLRTAVGDHVAPRRHQRDV